MLVCCHRAYTYVNLFFFFILLGLYRLLFFALIIYRCIRFVGLYNFKIDVVKKWKGPCALPINILDCVVGHFTPLLTNSKNFFLRETNSKNWPTQNSKENYHSAGQRASYVLVQLSFCILKSPASTAYSTSHPLVHFLFWNHQQLHIVHLNLFLSEM